MTDTLGTSSRTPLLTTPAEVADYLGDPGINWAQHEAAHNKARETLGIREGDRLWRLGKTIADHRANRPGCAHGWCSVCGQGKTLIDDLRLPAHIVADRYDRICPGSGQQAQASLPLSWIEARRIRELEL